MKKFSRHSRPMPGANTLTEPSALVGTPKAFWSVLRQMGVC
jgi:hypothetical protein